MSGMFRGTSVATIAAAIFLWVSPAGATVIWEDTFTRGDADDVGNGWVEVESDSKKVKLKDYAVRIEDKNLDASITQNGIDLSGFENIKIVFVWQANKTESDDMFSVDVQIANGGWSNVFQTGLGVVDTATTTSIAIGGADNAADFDIKFRTKAFNDKGERIVIDSVQIIGTEIAVTTAQATTSQSTNDVPAPGMLALFGLGMLGLGLARHRRRVR